MSCARLSLVYSVAVILSYYQFQNQFSALSIKLIMNEHVMKTGEVNSKFTFSILSPKSCFFSNLRDNQNVYLKVNETGLYLIAVGKKQQFINFSRFLPKNCFIKNILIF